MTRSEWANSSDPRGMLEFLLTRHPSDRKLRLFLVAVLREQIWRQPFSPTDLPPAIEGLPGGMEELLGIANMGENVAETGRWPTGPYAFGSRQDLGGKYNCNCLRRNLYLENFIISHFPGAAWQASCLRDIMGDLPLVLATVQQCNGCQTLFSPAIKRTYTCLNCGCLNKGPEIDSMDPWRLPLVTDLAQAVYDKRLPPTMTLDHGRMNILADALEEAGYPIDERGFDEMLPPLLAHLRSPGQHVRGCWAVDLILGKS